jgi:hypothetical protein
MDSDVLLPQKFTYQAHGRKVVFVKKAVESPQHVLMKALLWALYLPRYPGLQVEVPVGLRYRPDVVETDAEARPLFWGEAGKVSARKMRTLVGRYRSTHFAFAKWQTDLTPFEGIIAGAVAGKRRTAPLDLICFPADSAERFIDAGGHIRLDLSDLEWRRYGTP